MARVSYGGCLVRFPRAVGARLLEFSSSRRDPTWRAGELIKSGSVVPATLVIDAATELHRQRFVRRKDQHLARALVQTLKNKSRAMCPDVDTGFLGVRRRRRKS